MSQHYYFTKNCNFAALIHFKENCLKTVGVKNSKTRD